MIYPAINGWAAPGETLSILPLKLGMDFCTAQTIVLKSQPTNIPGKIQVLYGGENGAEAVMHM